MKRIIFLLVSVTSLLLGHENEIEALFNLSLEELMNVEVTTASQEKEKAAESLAVVSVFTSAQLKQAGALNLYEALSFLPGIQFNETYIGYSVLTFRGLTPGLYNNKALFMVNGHPVHEKLFGSSHLEFVPLDMVERIEVVRSPASVLYGTNAISGVVNVITKQGVKFDNETVLRTGSNNHAYGSLNFHDTHVSMGASYQNDDGYTYGGTKDELAQDINIDYKNNLSNVFIDIYGDKWRVQGAYYHSKKEKLGLNPILQHGGLNTFEAFYLDAAKTISIGEGRLKLWLRYDSMHRDLDTKQFPNPVSGNPITVNNRVERYSSEIQYKNTAFHDLSYIVGANYEYDKTGPTLFIDQTDGSIHPYSPFTQDQRTRNLALYSQGKYRFDERVVAIAGLRAEKNSDTDSTLNPRVGLNYEYTDDSYVKMLYSEAYRSPAFIEKYAYVPGVLLGNKALNREKIRTLELGADSQLNAKNSLQATIYYSKLEDEITRRTASGGGTEYYNGKDIKMYGIESSLNSIVNEKTELMLNASYVDGKREPNGMAEFIAHYTANMLLTYHFDQNWEGTLSDQYISSKAYVTTGGESGKIDQYNLTNITLSYLKQPFRADLYLKNLFDVTYTYPEPVRQNIKEVPGGPGTTLYLTLRYYF